MSAELSTDGNAGTRDHPLIRFFVPYPRSPPPTSPPSPTTVSVNRERSDFTLLFEALVMAMVKEMLGAVGFGHGRAVHLGDWSLLTLER